MEKEIEKMIDSALQRINKNIQKNARKLDWQLLDKFCEQNNASIWDDIIYYRKDRGFIAFKWFGIRY